MSRGYNARRKKKRQEARVAARSAPRADRTLPRHWLPLVPSLIVVGMLAAVGVFGFGTSGGMSKMQVKEEVTALLDGIPQRGSALGSPKAPITLWMYGDLECPTVKLLVENYLPSLIDDWVRTGVARLVYRSLETDTTDEAVFFKQETAALAAGRQGKMWNFLLTFVREQGEPRTGYVTSGFIDDIASQVPGLEMADWYSDRADARLSKQVALGVYSGHTEGFEYTPSFLMRFTKGEVNRRPDRAALGSELGASLREDLASLKLESSEDFPSLRTTRPNLLGG